MAGCACGEDFVVELCDLASGLVRTVVHPTSLDWQVNLNRQGRGSITLATRETLLRNIWPGLASVYISRINGGDPVCEFAGFVDQVQASDSNTTQLGLISIDGYLWHRTIKATKSFDNVAQTVIGRELVRLASPNGIPLFAEADNSVITRDRNYQFWNYKNIGEAVEQLTNVIDGPDWEIRHTRSQGAWSSTMIFRDFVGLDRQLILHSDRELSAYSITIDAKDLATWVDAVGEGQEEDQLHTTAVDNSGIYPQFDAVPAWNDVSRLPTLQQHADGYLEQNQEPDARPTVTISGLTPDPALLRNGDIVEIHVSYGTIAYRGKVRIISISWRLGTDRPAERTFEVVPLERASRSVLNQMPDPLDCEGCR